MRFWSLADCAEGIKPRGRWGANFEVRGEQLCVADLNPAGPLFGKGMRKGDVLVSLRWPARKASRSSAAAAMLEKLQSLPWGTQIVFEYARNGARPTGIPTPSGMATAGDVLRRRNGRMGLLDPEGYYDASMNGFRLFGWQVNRGLKRLPDFYRADQFYKELERPGVMERLLPAGSLDEALRQASVTPKVPPHEVLAPKSPPRRGSRSSRPLPESRSVRTATRVQARIAVPAGCKLLDAKAFANGVTAASRKLVSERPTDAGKEYVYEWELPLPSDPKDLIEVVVGTDSPTAAFGNVSSNAPAMEVARAPIGRRRSTSWPWA